MLASIFDSISTCATLRHVVHTSVFLFLINQYTALPEKTQSIFRKKGTLLAPRGLDNLICYPTDIVHKFVFLYSL